MRRLVILAMLGAMVFAGCEGGDQRMAPTTPKDGAGVFVTRLSQNHPNPFRSETRIGFSLAANGPAELVVYDVSGRRVRTLVEGGLRAGTHEMVWDGRDASGSDLPAGVYLVKLSTPTGESSQRMVMAR